MNDSKLIDLVEAQPSIYDKTDIFYSNKEYVRSIWQMIACEMQQEVPVCQKRWRYLRDYFVRQLHITENNENHSANDKKMATNPTSSNSNKRSYWPFYDRLSFLRPFSSTRRGLKRSPTAELCQTMNTYEDVNSTQSVCSDGSDDQTRISISSPTVSGNQLPTTTEDSISNLDYLKFCQALQMAAQQRFIDGSPNSNGGGGYENISPIEGYSNSLSQAKKKYENFENAIDEHDCFFKSILSSVRRINDEHIIAFRTEVLNALMKFRNLSEADDVERNEDSDDETGDANSEDEVVIVNTEEAHWRKNLFRQF